MKKRRKTYDKSFKENVVRLSYERKNISEFLKEVGISLSSLHRWRQEFETYGENSFPGNGKPKQTPEQAEIAKLKKELKEVEMERDILKKAVSIFSKNDGKFSGS